jgi:hypothetical protein
MIPLRFAAFARLRTRMARREGKALNIGEDLPEFTAFEYFRPVHLQPPQPGIAEQLSRALTIWPIMNSSAASATMTRSQFGMVARTPFLFVGMA